MAPAARAGSHASSRRLRSPGSIWARGHGAGIALALVGQYCDNDAPVRVLALTATVDPFDVVDYVVDDLSINPIHRFKRDLLARLQSLLGHLAGELSKGCSSTGTNPTHVHTDLALTSAATGSLQHCADEFIYGLRGSTSASYKEAYAFSISFDS